MSVRIFALILIAMALPVVPVMADELLMGDSIVQSDKDDCGGKIGKGCVEQVCCEPLWTFRAGLLVLKQETGGPFTDFDFEAGIDVSAMRRIGECRALEVRYMGVDDWNSSLLPPVAPPGSSAIFSSDLHSTEINLHRQWTDRISSLAGFRWVELHEELAVVAPQLGSLNMDIDNHMYGFQLGGQAVLWDRSGPLQLTTGAKAGIYYNNADATLDFTQGPLPPKTGDHTAFLGEWDLTAKVALSERIALRASYELLWIEGTAMVARQGGTNALDTGGSPFYHGGVIGVELTR